MGFSSFKSYGSQVAIPKIVIPSKMTFSSFSLTSSTGQSLSPIVSNGYTIYAITTPLTTYTVSYTCVNSSTMYILLVGGGGSGGSDQGAGSGGGGVVQLTYPIPKESSSISINSIIRKRVKYFNSSNICDNLSFIVKK